MRPFKTKAGRRMAKALLSLAVAIATLACFPRTALGNNFDDLFVMEYCSIIRQDDEGTYFGTANVKLTITYDNESLARAKERDFEIEKYRELRLDTQTGFVYFQPTVVTGENSTELRYTFDVENGREAAFWIVEDLHKRAVQPSLRVEVTIPDGMWIECETLGQFNSEVTMDGPSNFYLLDASVIGDDRDKAGMPNARVKWKVTNESNNADGNEDGEDRNLWDDENGGGNPPRGSDDDQSRIGQLGDALVMIGAAIITISLMFLVVALKRKKKREA